MSWIDKSVMYLELSRLRLNQTGKYIIVEGIRVGVRGDHRGGGYVRGGTTGEEDGRDGQTDRQTKRDRE